MSTTETIDYAAIIADLEAKKAALEATIASLRSAHALGTLGQSGETLVGTLSMPSVSGGEVPEGAFLSKSIPDAAKLYLEIVKRKQTSKDIAAGLKKGGIESTAQNFPGIVHSVLSRAARNGEGFVKLDRKFWGLSSWYPAGMRATAQPKRSKMKKSRKGVRKNDSKGRESVAAVGTAQPSEKPQKRVESILRNRPSAEFTAEDIAVELGVKLSLAHLLLGKLVRARRAEKMPSGKFKAAA